MIELWYNEAERYGVFPLASAGIAPFHGERPNISGPRQAGAAPIPFAVSPKVYNPPHPMRAQDGILITQDFLNPEALIALGAEVAPDE